MMTHRIRDLNFTSCNRRWHTRRKFVGGREGDTTDAYVLIDGEQEGVTDDRPTCERCREAYDEAGDDGRRTGNERG